MSNLLNITGRFSNKTALTPNESSFPTFVRQDTVVIVGTVSGEDLTALVIKGTLNVFDTDAGEIIKVAEKTATIIDVNPNIKRYQIVIANPSDTASFEPSTFYFDVQASSEPVSLGGVPMVKTLLGGFKTVLDYTLVVPSSGD